MESVALEKEMASKQRHVGIKRALDEQREAMRAVAELVHRACEDGTAALNTKVMEALYKIGGLSQRVECSANRLRMAKVLFESEKKKVKGQYEHALLEV